MAKENKTKYAILGVLSLMPASGYDIKKFCDSSIAHFWNENYGHIYPVLKQLNEDGWIEKTSEISEGKLRNVYTITELGKTKLVEWLDLPPEVPQARYEFLLKIFFSKNIPVQTVIDRLKKSKSFCSGLLKQYQAIAEHLEDSMVKKSEKESSLPYMYSTIRYGILDMEAKVKWCAESIEMLSKIK